MDGDNLILTLDNSVRGLLPGLMPASTLARIVALVEAAIVESSDTPSEEHLPAVAFTGIEEGSIINMLKVASWAAAAAVSVFGAIATKDYSGIRVESHKKLLELSKFISDNDLTANIHGFGGVVSATISVDNPVEQIKQQPTIKSGMTVYGEVKSVGGDVPTVSLRVQTSTKLFKASVTAEMAIALGKRLYDYVGIKGVATINLKTGEVVHFRATEISGYKGKAADPLAAIDSIEKKYPGRWDGIDPSEYAAKLRSGEE